MSASKGDADVGLRAIRAAFDPKRKFSSHLFHSQNGSGLVWSGHCGRHVQRGQMRRREFITLIGGAAAAAPFAAKSQQPARVRRVPNVGILNYAAADDALVNDFRSSLGELGYVEGKSLNITYRWADGHSERLPNLAGDLIASNVDVIIS